MTEENVTTVATQPVPVPAKSQRRWPRMVLAMVMFALAWGARLGTEALADIDSFAALADPILSRLEMAGFNILPLKFAWHIAPVWTGSSLLALVYVRYAKANWITSAVVITLGAAVASILYELIVANLFERWKFAATVFGIWVVLLIVVSFCLHAIMICVGALAGAGGGRLGKMTGRKWLLLGGSLALPTVAYVVFHYWALWTTVRDPYVMMTAAAGVLASAVVGLLIFTAGTAWLSRPLAEGMCTSCGYDLRGMLEAGRTACPECGEAIAK